MFFLGIVDVIILLVTLSIGLIVTVPLDGILVRLRANYNPKGLQLDGEGGVQPHTGPVVTGYFAMAKRVWRLEGLSGLYKGFMPTLLSALVLTGFAVGVLNDSVMNPRRPRFYNAPVLGPIQTLIYGVFDMLVSLPAVIITYRSITTPHKLPYFKPMKALRMLLTPTERRRPWILYLTPGLLVTQVFHIAFTTLCMRPLGRLVLPRQEDSQLPTFTPLRWLFYLGLVLASTAILTPLEVIATRLSIQRNHASPQFNSVAQEEEGDAEDFSGYIGAEEEDVIGLRSEEDPYNGMIDCAKRILDEEGWGALYRAWWLTLLGGFALAGSP